MASYGTRALAALLLTLLGAACKSSAPTTLSADTVLADTTTWATYLAHSLQAFQRGDTLHAFQALDSALAQDSSQPYLYELKGFYHYTRGEDAQALLYYQRAIELGGTRPELHYRIGAAYLTQQRWQEAYHHFRKALQADSANPEVWTSLGLWAYQQKNYRQAAAFWKEAFRRDSSLQSKARTFLYDLYLNELAQPETAKKYYLDPYWRLHRFDPLLNLQLGNYFLKKLEAKRQAGQPVRAWATEAFQATQAYTQAILAHPSYAQAYYNRGYVYFLTGKYDRALEDFSRAAELNPKDARAHFMQGSLYELRGDTLKALQAYQRALAIDPAFPEAQKALQELQTKKGR